MACVLRGFLSATYFKYAANKKPCAALPIEKTAHLETENTVYNIKDCSSFLNQKLKEIPKKGFLRAKDLVTQKAFFNF
jgi:hypothetical protein